MGITLYGLNLFLGYSIIKSNQSLKNTFVYKYWKEIKTLEFKKSCTNIGLSFMYMCDNSIWVHPFINFEKILKHILLWE